MLKNIKKIGTIFNNKYTNMFKKYSATKKKWKSSIFQMQLSDRAHFLIKNNYVV